MTQKFKKNGLTRLERMRLEGMSHADGIIENKQLRKMCDSVDAAASVIDNIIRGLDPATIIIRDANDLYKLMNSQTGLVRARVELERVMLETIGLYGEACSAVMDELRTHLAGYPELLSEVLAIAERSGIAADPRSPDPDSADQEQNMG